MSNPTSLDTGALFAAVFCILGAVGLAMPRQSVAPQPDFEAHGWSPEPERLQAALAADRKLVAAHRLDASAGAAREAYLRFGAIEAESGGRDSDPTYRAASETAIKALLDYWYSAGEDRYRALGVRLADEFVDACQQVLDEATRSGMSARRWLKKNRGSKRAQQLFGLAGNFMDHAVGWGLITAENRVVGGFIPLLRIHFKVRWYRFVTDAKDYTFLMDPEELRALWRFRLEADQSLPMDQRLQVARWLRDLDADFPVFRSLGAVYARQGQLYEAIGMYREALLDAPFDTDIAANLSFLLREAERRQTSR